MSKQNEVNYSRRNVIAGMLAAPAVAAVPAVASASVNPISVSDELAWMIDLNAELYHEADQLDDLNEAIVERPDYPMNLSVNLNEVRPGNRDYWQRSIQFESHAELDTYYNELMDAGFFDEQKLNRLWRARVNRDWNKLSALMRSRFDAAEEWLAESGLKANERRIAEIEQLRRELKQKIAVFPCRSIHDVLAKITYAYEQVEVTILGELQLIQMLSSMREFAEANCHPTAIPGRQSLVS